MAGLIERRRDRIKGVLSCFDRVLIQGTLPSVCHAKAMSMTLDSRDIRLFDYATEFAQPYREAIHAHAERVAAEGGIEVQYIKKPLLRHRHLPRPLPRPAGNHQIVRNFSIRIHRGTHPPLPRTRLDQYVRQHGFILRVETTTSDDLLPTPPHGGTARRQASLQARSPQEVHPLTLSRPRTSPEQPTIATSSSSRPSRIRLRASTRCRRSLARSRSEHRYRGFNFFRRRLSNALRGSLPRRALHPRLPQSLAPVCPLLSDLASAQRLRLHGVIKEGWQDLQASSKRSSRTPITGHSQA